MSPLGAGRYGSVSGISDMMENFQAWTHTVLQKRQEQRKSFGGRMTSVIRWRRILSKMKHELVETLGGHTVLLRYYLYTNTGNICLSFWAGLLPQPQLLGQSNWSVHCWEWFCARLMNFFQIIPHGAWEKGEIGNLSCYYKHSFWIENTKISLGVII